MIKLNDTQKSIITYILKDEGGYTNNPQDHGGPTNFGITLKDLAEWRGQPVTAQDVENMQLSEAQEIYYEWYLKPMSIDQIKSMAIATALADTGILYGSVTTIRLAQTVCKGFGYGLVVDGMVGPITLKALNMVNPSLFIKNLHDQIISRIDEIISHDESQVVFKEGWTDRANKLLELVS